MTAQNPRHMVLVTEDGDRKPRIENYDSVTEMMQFVAVYTRSVTSTVTKSTPRDCDFNVTVHGVWDLRKRGQKNERVVACTIETPMLEHVRVVVTKRDSNGVITRQTESAAMTVETYTVVDGRKVEFPDPHADAPQLEFDKQVKLANASGKSIVERKDEEFESNWGPGCAWNGMEGPEVTVTHDDGSTVTVTEVLVPNPKTSAFFRPPTKLKAI